MAFAAGGSAISIWQSLPIRNDFKVGL